MSIEIIAPAAAAVALIAAIIGLVYWWHRPTATDKAVYTLGFNDGADGRKKENFEHPHNAMIYLEAYAHGSQGREIKADAATIRKRQESPTWSNLDKAQHGTPERKTAAIAAEEKARQRANPLDPWANPKS